MIELIQVLGLALVLFSLAVCITEMLLSYAEMRQIDREIEKLDDDFEALIIDEYGSVEDSPFWYHPELGWVMLYSPADDDDLISN